MTSACSFDLVGLSRECDAAIDAQDLEKLRTLIGHIENLNVSVLRDADLCAVTYMMGNLYASVSSVSKEDISAWREGNFPKFRVEAINCYRTARVLAAVYESPLISQITTNLSNEIAHQGRIIESISTWDTSHDPQCDAPVVTAYAKARSLMWLSHFINDPGHADCYQIEAYKLLKALEESISEKDHPLIYGEIKSNPEFQKFINYGDKEFQDSLDWAKSDVDQSYSDAEKRYRLWSLLMGLFANDLNDLTAEWIADMDILQFPTHTVKIGEGPYLSSAFSAIKREYCFARFLAYEGINDVHPKYENEHLFLTDTYDGVSFEGSLEKIKTAFRISFSVLDSVATLLNQYFNCQSKSTAFSSRWIKANLSSYKNPFIDALYWLACDLTDASCIPDDKWQAPNPDGAEIRRMRNSIEHGWLRVVEYDSEPPETQNDYAHIVSAKKLKHLTIDILRFSRAAMQYLCFAVKYEEDRKSDNQDKELYASQIVPLWEPLKRESLRVTSTAPPKI